MNHPPIPEGHRTTAKTQTGDEMEIAISCQDANRIIAALTAQNRTLRNALADTVAILENLGYRDLKSLISTRAALAATEKEKA